MEEIEVFHQRQRIKVLLDYQDSPRRWAECILSATHPKFRCLVSRYLVSAVLRKRFPEIELRAFSVSTRDAQTEHPGSLVIGSSVYHVTTTPDLAVIRKCREHLAAGKHPVLIVPRDKIDAASSRAEAEGIETRISIFGMEDFLTLSIIQMSDGEQARFIETLRDILQEYNRRIESAETDQSLKIEMP